jgi:hypothetical protein
MGHNSVRLAFRLHPTDWQIISSLAIGMDYGEISKEIGATPGSLRVHVTRLRGALRLAA